jgi:hypothetical protein
VDLVGYDDRTWSRLLLAILASPIFVAKHDGS